MRPDFASKLAEVVTEYSTAVGQGDFVVIIGSSAAAPLIEALYAAVLRRGGNPHVEVGLPGLGELRLQLASDDQLDFMDPIRKLVIEEADVILQIDAPTNTKALASADPQKMARWQRAMAPLVPIQLRRMTDRSLRWCFMPWPTGAAAQQTEMGIHAYTDFLYEACALQEEDPIAHWQSVKERQSRLVDFLQERSRVEVRGPGIELSFEYEGRKWVSAHGEANFPDGEIFTGPLETSVNGSIAFNMPTVLYGRETSGVSLTFEDGVVVKASASKGDDFLQSQLTLDEGARRMGEFAIGTNWGVDRITGSTLLDEKIGGTVHMALGASIPETGGKNESTLHWDMVHDMKEGGEIYVDGELFYREGRFVLLDGDEDE